MIDLNKEAEDIIFSQLESDSDGFESFYRYNEVIKGIIAGYNSKATQAKVIQSQIDLCNSALNWSNEIDETSNYLEKQLSLLRQQLKELEND
jgi:hypothetical protein